MFFEFNRQQLYPMSLCQKANNIQDIIQTVPQITSNYKYSLKDKKFISTEFKTPLSKKSWKKAQASSRFLSFMQEHNSELVRKNLDVELSTQQKDLGCFDNNCINGGGQILVHKIQAKRHPTFETLTSSNASEFASTQPLYPLKEHQRFKINTHSILQQLSDEGYLSPESRDKIRSSYQKSQKLNRSEVRSKVRSSYEVNDKQRKRKISLKGVKNQNKYQQLNRKESLNYQQLSDPLSLANEMADDINSLNLQVSIVLEEYPNLSDSLKRKEKSDCKCRPNCKYISKWMAIASKSVVSNQKRYLVDEKTKIQIDKDIPRTQKSRLFCSQFYKRHLKEVLLEYASLNPSNSYVQGMNFIASAIIFHTRQFSQSSKIFNFLMIERNFQKIYENNFQTIGVLTQHLCKELEKYSPSLKKHITNCGVQLEIFARGWYLSMFGTFVPLQSMHLIIDKFFRKGFIGLNQIMLTLFIYLKQELLESEQDEVGTKLSNSWLAEEGKKINWQKLISCSDNFMLSNITF